MTETTNVFPGFDHLFSMHHHSYGENDFFANLERGTPHRELLRGEWVPQAPLMARWADGNSEPRDIAWGQTIDWFYLSSRVQELFRDNKLTGWATYPIILHNKAGDVCEGYAGLSITGRCGPIDEERGELVPGQKPDRNFLQHFGLYFDETTWDGSDFFCPAGNNSYKFVTENVKHVFEENDIGGFEFTPLTQRRWFKKRGT